MFRFLASVGAIFAAVLGGGASVAAQSDVYPPRPLVISQNVDTVGPGGTFVVTLAGCRAGEVATFALADESITADCDHLVQPRALASSDRSVGRAEAMLTASDVPGASSGTVALDGEFVGEFEITVGYESENVPANLNVPAAAVALDVVNEPRMSWIPIALAAILFAAAALLRPKLA